MERRRQKITVEPFCTDQTRDEIVVAINDLIMHWPEKSGGARFPMETAPRDGRLIKLWMGSDQEATVGWWKPGHLPWCFLDRQTGPGSHFVNQAVFGLPIAWAPLD